MSPLLSLRSCALSRRSALLRKMITKLVQRVGTCYMPERDRGWRYSVGGRTVKDGGVVVEGAKGEEERVCRGGEVGSTIDSSGDNAADETDEDKTETDIYVPPEL